MSVDVWVATEDTPKEMYRRGELICEGLELFSVDPPERGYRFTHKVGVIVDLGLNPALKKQGYVQSIPKDCFVSAFYVNTWNSWISVAARRAKLMWTEDARDAAIEP